MCTAERSATRREGGREGGREAENVERPRTSSAPASIRVLSGPTSAESADARGFANSTLSGACSVASCFLLLAFFFPIPLSACKRVTLCVSGSCSTERFRPTRSQSLSRVSLGQKAPQLPPPPPPPPPPSCCCCAPSRRPVTSRTRSSLGRPRARKQIARPFLSRRRPPRVNDTYHRPVGLAVV